MINSSSNTLSGMTDNVSTSSLLPPAEDKQGVNKDISLQTLQQCQQNLEEKHETERKSGRVHEESNSKPEPANAVAEPESGAEDVNSASSDRHNSSNSKGDDDHTCISSESSHCHVLHTECENESTDTSSSAKPVGTAKTRLLNSAPTHSTSTKKSVKLHKFCERDAEMDLSTERHLSSNDTVKEPRFDSMQHEGGRFEYDMNGVQIPKLYQNKCWLSESEPETHSVKYGQMFADTANSCEISKHGLLDSSSDFGVKSGLRDVSVYPVRLIANYHTVQESSNMPLDMSRKFPRSRDRSNKPTELSTKEPGLAGRCGSVGESVTDKPLDAAAAKPKQLYRCRTCNDTFPTRHYLSVHSRLHSGESHQCHQCLAAFSRLSSLKDHLKTHTGEKPHTCKLCGSAFSKMSSLKDHTRIHTGEKPYQCPTCPASFSQQTSLKKHTRTHTGERPYKCQQCDAAFAQQSNLKTHLRTHSGEKPYHCDVCDSSFSQLAGLRKHSKTHNKHGVEGQAVE